MKEKICTACNQTLSITEFYKNGKYFFSECKKCSVNRVKKYNKNHSNKIKMRIRKWYKENPDKIKEYNKRKYLKNRDKILALNKLWRKQNFKKVRAANKNWSNKNRKKMNEYSRIYYNKNSLLIKEKQKTYRKIHPEKIREFNRRRRALKMGAVGNYTFKEELITKTIFCYCCFNCKRTNHLEIDHNIALINGGTNEIDNMVVLCRFCNASKSNKMPEQFYTTEQLFELNELLGKVKEIKNGDLKWNL